jgi:hypothetical protein
MLAVSPLSSKDFLPNAQIETLSKADGMKGRYDGLNAHRQSGPQAQTPTFRSFHVGTLVDF